MSACRAAALAEEKEALRSVLCLGQRLGVPDQPLWRRQMARRLERARDVYRRSSPRSHFNLKTQHGRVGEQVGVE